MGTQGSVDRRQIDWTETTHIQAKQIYMNESIPVDRDERKEFLLITGQLLHGEMENIGNRLRKWHNTLNSYCIDTEWGEDFQNIVHHLSSDLAHLQRHLNRIEEKIGGEKA